MPRRNKTPVHQPFKPSYSCQAKRRFKTNQQALAAAQHQMLLDWKLELTTYNCPQCGFWHLTRLNSGS